MSEVLDALEAQTRQPDRLVAVDLGSTDATRSIIINRHGPEILVDVAAATPFADAVQAGLDAFGPPAGPSDPQPGDETEAVDDESVELGPIDWIWILHDDTAPDPDALHELVLRVTHSPSVWLAGPKVRDWTDTRLLQAGLSIDATGHVDGDLDIGELDQGQGDDTDEVLAVGTAGAFIRRDVWDRLGGMDPAWSRYGDEVDLGWRVNAAGGRVVIAARAVVRHAAQGCVGSFGSQTGMAPIVVRRRNGMQVVLSNTAAWLVPILLMRYLLGGALRAGGLLLISRRPSAAAAELVAVAEVASRPRVILTGRRDRAMAREVSHGDLRRLFPAAAGRWRNSPIRTARPQFERAPTSRRRVAVETGPVSEDVEELSTELSMIGAFVRRPSSLLFIVMALLSLIAERHVLSGALYGGRLLSAPAGSRNLWATYLSTWHPSGVGSTTPAPPWIGILAAASTVLLGKVWLAVDIVVLGAVPLAALSAFTAMRAVTGAVRIRVWLAVVYALLPVLTGAVAGGRLDVLVAAIVLPRIIRSSALAVFSTDPMSRARVVGAGLWLAIGSAFAPLLWVAVAVFLVLAVGLTRLAAEDSDGGTSRRPLARAVWILAIPVVLLVPWSWHVVAHPGLLVAGIGLPEFFTSQSAPSGIALALLHAGWPAQAPIWIGIPILAAAALGLQRDSRVIAARLGALALIAGVALAVAETRAAGVVGGLPASRRWPGLALLIAGTGALLAALVAAVGARPALRGRSFSWRQPAAVGVVVLALAATATLGIGWMIRGAGRPLTTGDPNVLPLFTQAEMAASTSPRALVVTAAGPVVRYALVRRPVGPRLGDADTMPGSGGAAGRASAALAGAVRDLVAGRPGAGAELVPFGIEYIVAPAGTTHRINSALGRAATLTVVPAPGATVWRSALATGELTVLDGSRAAIARSGHVPPAAAAAVLAARPGSADTVVPPATGPAPGGRLLVLAEPESGHWKATLDGRALPRASAYGWAQAFVLPDTAGRLRISYSDGARTGWLVIELVALVAVIGVGLVAPPTPPRREPV